MTAVSHAEFGISPCVNRRTSERTGKARLHGGAEKTFRTRQDVPGSHAEATRHTVQETDLPRTGVRGNPTIQFADVSRKVTVGGRQPVPAPEPTARLRSLPGPGRIPASPPLT